MEQNNLKLEELRSGDVLGFRSNVGFWGKLIKVFTQSQVCHVGLVHCDSVLGYCVVESKEGRGVRKVQLKPYINKWQLVEVYRVCSDNIEEDAVVWALAQEDIGYAPWWQFVLSFGLVSSWIRKKLTKLAGVKIHADLSTNTMHCSEFVSSFLIRNGEVVAKEPACMSPQDVIDSDCLCKLGRLVPKRTEVK